MKIRYLTIAAILTAAAGTAGGMTPQEAAEAILSRNGDRLLAELTRNAKDEETRSMANAPDPELEADYKVAPSGVDDKWGVGISYGIDWPGAYGARRKLAKAMRDANSTESEAVMYSRRMEILDEIMTYLYAERRLDMMRSVLASTDSIQVIAGKASRGGELSRLDLSKIAIEQSRIESVINGMETEAMTSVGNLKTLNGGADCRALLGSIDKDWDITPVPSIEECLARTGRNPELAQAMSEYNVAGSNVSVAKAESLPGFSIGYSHEFEEGAHFNGASLGISLPLFASRHKVKAAEAAMAAAEYNVTVTTDRIESQVKSLHEEVMALDKALKTPSDIFRSTDYTSMLMKAYKGGELSLTEYLRELSWFYEAHMDYLSLQYERERKANRLSLLCR